MRATSHSRRPMLQLAAALALTALTVPAWATGFLPSVQGLPSRVVRVITAAGQVLDGVVTTTLMSWRGVRRITIKETNGAKHRLKARDIDQLLVDLGAPMGRESMVLEATTTLVKAVKTDYRWIAETSELVFDSLAYPKPDQRVLLPLVNPGFSSRIRVYGLANDREWTHSIGKVAIFGDEPDAYVVVKDGGRPWKIEDGDYEDQFRKLFGDCPEVLKQFDDPDFDDMADHVLAYESLCPAG